MSEMSKAQRPVGGGRLQPDRRHGAAGAQAPQDPDSPQDRSEYDGSEDVGPQDYGAEDVASQGYGSENKPLPRTGESLGEESSPSAQSSSDPLPDIAGQAEPDS